MTLPKASADILKARIAVLQKQLAEAEKNKAPAIRKVLALMKKLGVTLADLRGGEAAAPKRGKTRARKGGKRRGPAPIKCRDGAGNTWSGRGKTPRWLVEAEQAGKHRDQFAV